MSRHADRSGVVDGAPIPARLPKRRAIRGHSHLETRLGWFDSGERRKVAIVITADGRRIHVPIEPARLTDVSLLDLLRSIPGLDSLLGLITGSRRDRGTRRGERR
jgi:hypothetical protein